MVIKSNKSKKIMIWDEHLKEIYFSKDSSGDSNLIRGFTCCRLCGGHRNLRGMKETYLWEGVEERFDHVLSDCFGVKASPEDCNICTSCINQLMIAYKFKALVQAAFTKTCSNGTSYTSGENRIEISPDDITESSELKNQDDSKLLINKEILDILSRKMARPQKRALKRKVVKISNLPKKVIATCSMCGQKYPLMIVGDDGVKEFVCSRCKLKRNTTDVKKLNLGLRKDEKVKADDAVKARLLQPKKPAQIKNFDSSSKSYLKQTKAGVILYSRT